ncbi:polysaccharide biosynthesis protein [Subtercola boreus]|uniref:polysaccharide biosynthesis protein n=1 Tax=Subtercola boreus TaxID=120213 RepID=UPI00117404D6|nr:polysaccharide biosynthesis protein [Subtercola boreus]TQL54511.1 O-antigen/teichoic acid export membrane protein [Subtercola boreus]
MTRQLTTTAGAPPKGRGILASVGSTAVAKVAVMALSGILGIITSRMIIHSFGTEAYAQYGLLASFPTLLPFADLGIAAVVINAVAGSASPRTDDFVRRTITTAFRILIVSGAIMIAVGVVITALGWWPALLGNGLIADGGSLAAFACLAIFGLVIPLTVGQRVLVGLGKTNVQVASQSVVAPFMFLAIGALVLLAVPAGTYLAVISYVGNALVSVICLFLAARVLKPQIGAAIREIPHIRSYRGVSAIGLAWPMLLQMIALPIALQTGRLLLSQIGTPQQLAEYNLSSQLFQIVLQTTAAAGLAMWPIYAKARSAGRIESPVVPTLWFLAGGLVLGGILAVASPWLTAFVSGGKITLDLWVILPWVLFVGLQAAKYPVGMYMTDKRGLVFQVVPILIMVPLNLGLSVLFIGMIGAGGPVLGSTISVLVCQFLPNLWYVSRDLARRRREA